jgi:hypothetical protein
MFPAQWSTQARRRTAREAVIALAQPAPPL